MKSRCIRRFSLAITQAGSVAVARSSSASASQAAPRCDQSAPGVAQVREIGVLLGQALGAGQPVERTWWTIAMRSWLERVHGCHRRRRHSDSSAALASAEA